jgi:putative flippase GtrA
VSQTTLFNRLSQRRGIRQFIKFGIVGSSGLIVNLALFTLLQRVIPNHAQAGPYFVIYSVSFLAGGVSNYFLNRAWTFRSTGHVAREGLSFLSVSALALLVALATSAVVAPWLGHGHKTWFVATLAGIFVNFFINKYWTFRSVR